MAAVAAIINTDHAPLDASLLRAVVGVAHGPPSDTRITIDNCMGLACVPVAGDAPAGQQGSFDGPVLAVMDGRLDDREALAAMLAGNDTPADLAAVSDAALIVRAYEMWGDDCVSHLLGDFAFCLWDARNRRLLCARDHFGVKPLYYARVGNALIVSSVLRWVKRHPAVSRTLRSETIGDFLLFGMCADPSRTSFADISRVPPGHCLSYSLPRQSLHVGGYWALQPGELIRYADPRQYVDHFSQLLQVAVADRVRDGSVGVLMSGGLDSSSVAAVAADVVGSGASNRVRAFTVVYDTLMQDEERRYSSLVTTALGIPISHIPADRYRPFERWEGEDRPPEPSLEGLTAVMLDVLDLVSRHGGAVLTGDGGDPMLLPSSVTEQLGRVPIGALAIDLVRAWALRMRPPLGIRSRVARWFGESQDVPAWLGNDLLRAFDPHARWRDVQVARSAAVGARSTAVNEVADPWWTSTFESFDPGATRRPVELRYPFFDVRLASFLLRLPSFPWCLNKQVLRVAMNGRLPEPVRTRSKAPLPGSPIGPGEQWSWQRALDLFEATPEMAAFVHNGKFRAQVDGESLLSNESFSAWAAISLANWLKCESAAGVVGIA